MQTGVCREHHCRDATILYQVFLVKNLCRQDRENADLLKNE